MTGLAKASLTLASKGILATPLGLSHTASKYKCLSNFFLMEEPVGFKLLIFCE